MKKLLLLALFLLMAPVAIAHAKCPTKSDVKCRNGTTPTMKQTEDQDDNSIEIDGQWFLGCVAFFCVDKSGQRQGNVTIWDEDGKKLLEGKYRNNRRHDKWTRWWHESCVPGKRQKVTESEYRDGKAHGTWTSRYKSGTKEVVEEYRDEKLHGKRTEWYPSGELYSKGGYKDGKLHGKWTFWTPDKKKFKEEQYKDGQLTSPSSCPKGTTEKWEHYEEGESEVDCGAGVIKGLTVSCVDSKGQTQGTRTSYEDGQITKVEQCNMGVCTAVP